MDDNRTNVHPYSCDLSIQSRQEGDRFQSMKPRPSETEMEGTESTWHPFHDFPHSFMIFSAEKLIAGLKSIPKRHQYNTTLLRFLIFGGLAQHEE